MPELDEQRVRRLEQTILQYLEAHPDAADSMTGIQQWWLPGRQLDVGVRELKAALDRLVQRDQIRCATLPDGTLVYSRAPAPSRNRDDPNTSSGEPRRDM